MYRCCGSEHGEFLPGAGMQTGARSCSTGGSGRRAMSERHACEGAQACQESGAGLRAIRGAAVRPSGWRRQTRDGYVPGPGRGADRSGEIMHPQARPAHAERRPAVDPAPRRPHVGPARHRTISPGRWDRSGRRSPADARLPAWRGAPPARASPSGAPRPSTRAGTPRSRHPSGSPGVHHRAGTWTLAPGTRPWAVTGRAPTPPAAPGHPGSPPRRRRSGRCHPIRRSPTR